MSIVYSAPVEDVRFLLFELFRGPDHWAATDAYAHVDADTVTAVLEEAGKLAAAEFAPLNQSGDAEGCTWTDGQVTTPTGFAAAYRQFAEGGWNGLGGRPEYGGMGLPKMVTVAAEEFFFAANTSLYLYPALTVGASLCLASHASDAIREKVLPKLYAGSWAGTMCLTEAHAGTDLGLMRTRAEPLANGRYAITGTKIFITGGEQDLTDNIVHLVLARLPDAPAGTRGISLFLVSKHRLDDALEATAAANGVSSGSIEHKMGIRGSATNVMHFDGAEGLLIGEPHRGLAAMFTMMNYERLSIGIQGLGLGDIAYQNAAAYARERLQGRAPSGDASEPASILEHPDVRRMLLTVRAYNEAGRAFAAYVGLQLDLAHAATDDVTRRRAEGRVALLTPVAKAFFSDRGLDCTVLAQQVLGGHGYVAEWGLEQFVRDARIAQIYEGANGIQALDLMDRKVVRDGASALGLLCDDMMADVEAARGTAAGSNEHGDLRAMADELEGVIAETRALAAFVQAGSASDPALVGASAVDYLEHLGHVVYAWLWLRMARRAADVLSGSDGAVAAPGFYDDKRRLARFYFDRVLPAADAAAARVRAGSDAVMAFAQASF